MMLSSRAICLGVLLGSVSGTFLAPRNQEISGWHTNLLLLNASDERARQAMQMNSTAGTPRLVIENNCGEKVRFWGLFGDGTHTDSIDLEHESIHIFSNDEVTCGQHKKACNTIAQVMYFRWPEDEKWDNTLFSEEFEFAHFNNLQFNFDSQRSFSMPLGVAFVGNDGNPVQGCPEPNLYFCTAPGNEGKCASNMGQYDVCDFDATRCPDKAWRVKTSLETNKFYCISPDSELAVISPTMPDLTNEQCKHQIPGTRQMKGCHDLSCRDPHQKAAIEQYFGGTNNTDPNYTCLPWLNFPMPLQDQTDANGKGSHLPLYMEVPRGSGQFVPVTQDVFRDPVGNSNAGDFVGESLPQGSAKVYQSTVNKMCGNQPASQWAKWDGDATSAVEFFDPSGVPGTGTGDGKCGALSGQQQRAIPTKDEKLLDHAMTYEGDESRFWWDIRHEEVTAGCSAKILKAGNAGIMCNAPGKREKVVEVRLKTCPNGNPYK